MFSYETCLSALNYKPFDDDVFIVTYPKNGTTWTQQIVILLQNNGNLPDDVAKGDMSLRSPFLEYRGADSLKQLTRPYSIKTHIEGNSHPWNPHAKYIIVLRNPKDALVSFYYHHTSSPEYGIPDLSFDNFFELFMDGEVECGSYFDWVLSWWQRKDFDNVMVTTYEGRLKDPVGDVTQIAEFLNIVYDDDIIKRTVEMSSFGAMRKAVNEWKKCNFLRKGIVGDWSTHFNDDQNKRLENMFHQKFDGTGLENLWNDYM
ncbi:hypothetical protein HA402_003130 [Bradysia odoriphaga]|nr:hypothetical protein HA402_003130 [Bradysia odoriphaga]